MMVAAVAVAAGIAAAGEQNDDDDKPQAGTVVVSVIEPHDCHLTSEYSMRQTAFESLTNSKTFMSPTAPLRERRVWRS